MHTGAPPTPRIPYYASPIVTLFMQKATVKAHIDFPFIGKEMLGERSEAALLPCDRSFPVVEADWPGAWQSTMSDIFWAELWWNGSHVADVSKHYLAQSGRTPSAAGGWMAGRPHELDTQAAASYLGNTSQGLQSSSCSGCLGNRYPNNELEIQHASCFYWKVPPSPAQARSDPPQPPR